VTRLSDVSRWRRGSGAGLWLCITMVAAVLLAACGGSASPGAGGSGSGGASQEKVKLVYFNARGADPVEQAMVKKYQELHPNVTIQYLSSTSLSGPSDTDAIANLIFNIQAHTEIDVAKVEVTRTPLDLMAAKASQNLGTIDGPAVQSRLGQLAASNIVSFDNGVWALPYENDPFGLVYNATLFSQAGIKSAPTNWSQWRQDNKTLKQKFPDTWPICIPIKNLSKIQPLVWGAGGGYWNKDILPTKAAFDNQGIKDAYSFVQEWATNGWMNTSDINTTNSIQWMVSHKCAAMDYSSALAQSLQFNDPSTDWRVAPLPAKDASHKPVNFVGGSALAIPSTAKYPKQALEFAMWLTSQQGQDLKYGVDSSLNLSRADLSNEALPSNRATGDKLKSNKSWQQPLATMNVPSRPSGISPAYSNAYQLLADMQERIVLKRTSVDQELASTQQQVQALLDKSIQKNPELYK
jgi:multiple sugar transport system substrate-binding protein